jgi:hypothetical protein
VRWGNCGKSFMSALAVATVLAGCDTARDERSYQAGYHDGAALAAKMVRNGYGVNGACHAQAEASNGFNPQPYNTSDFEQGCLDALHR